MPHRRTHRLLLVAASWAVVRLAGRLDPAAAMALGAPLVVAATVLVPGLAACAAMRARAGDRVERAGAVLLAGWTVVMFAAAVWAMSGCGFGGFEMVLFGSTAVLALAAPPAAAAGERTRVVPEGAVRVRDRAAVRARAALVGLCALCATLVWQAGPPVDFQKDTLDYAAWADEVAATAEAFPLTAYYADPGDDGRDFRKGLLHAVQGYWCARTGLDALHLFEVLAALLVAMGGVLACTIARWLGASPRAAAAAGALFLLGPSTDESLRTLFYPGHFGALPAMAAAALLARYARTGRRTQLGAAMALSFTAVAMHSQYAVLLGAAVAAVVAWRPASARPWRVHLRRSVGGGAAMAGAFSPYFAWRVATAYRANPLHAQVQRAMYLFDGAFVADPTALARAVGWVGVAALAVLVAAWRVRERHGALLLGGVTLVLALAVEANPLALPLVYAAVTYLAWRLPMVAPTWATAAGAIDLPRGGFERSRARRLALACGAIAIVAGVHAVATGALGPRAAREAAGGPMRWRAALARLDAELPAGSVIASDPVTSYAITAATRHRVLCTLDQHAPPNDLRADERMAAARVVLGPFSSMAERVRAARRWGVTHVVINTDVPRHLVLDDWTLPTEYAVVARRAFDGSRAARRVFEEAPLVVYELTGEPGEPVRVARPPLASRIDPEARRVARDAGAAHLEAARVWPRRVPRGGWLDVDLYWRSKGPRPERANWVVSIRLDAIDARRPRLDRPWAKPVRKILERVRGQRLRARSDHMLAWGFFGPDAWPADARVLDATRMRVPPDLAPGRYRVEARLHAQAHMPNYRLRDFLYDDDRYRGVAVDTITVSP